MSGQLHCERCAGRRVAVQSEYKATLRGNAEVTAVEADVGLGVGFGDQQAALLPVAAEGVGRSDGSRLNGCDEYQEKCQEHAHETPLPLREGRGEGYADLAMPCSTPIPTFPPQGGRGTAKARLPEK